MKKLLSILMTLLLVVLSLGSVPTIIYADEIEVPIVRTLTNGTVLDFDYQHNLLAISFPNFFKMMHRSPSNMIYGISLEGTQIIDRDVIFTFKIDDQLVNIKVDMKEL